MTAVLVLGILFMLIGYELYSKEARDALMSSADTALSFTDKPEEIYDVMKNAVSFDVRVTMIDNDGNVLYDSTSPAALSENHLDRPEVRQAIENGSGTAERYSNTLSRRTYYYAVKTDGGIIRFSCNTQGISAIFLGAIPIFLAAWGLVMVVAVVVSMKLSENIVTPIRKMIKSMDVFDDTIEESIADYSEYEELLPMVKLVARMKREIKDYIASLSAEKNTIGLITANMTEGMILIDRNDDIISINRSACDLVNPVFPAESGRNIIEFCRNTDFMELIEQSKCAASVTGTFSSEGRFLRAFISRISSEDKLSGAVIIIVDETEIHHLSADCYMQRDIFFLGRNIDYALALEGSLKLKEISYIHSEAYAGGELKHGTISLIEDGTLVIALGTYGPLFDKAMSNVVEVKARGADVLALTTESHRGEMAKTVDHVLTIPDTAAMLLPSLGVVPLQLFSYYIALQRGCDIDKPRNLAKSVTVE